MLLYYCPVWQEKIVFWSYIRTVKNLGNTSGNFFAQICKAHAKWLLGHFFPPKAKSNYRWYNRKSSNPNFFIHFFIDNSIANISLHTLSCPKLTFGQLKAYKLMLALELSMKKGIKIFWIARFLVIPTVEKCQCRNCLSL